MARPPDDPSVLNLKELVEASKDSTQAKQDKPRLLERLPGGSPGLRTPTPQELIPGLRVPKHNKTGKPSSAAAVELSEALSVLTEMVRQAEAFLRKQPGTDRANVPLRHLELPTDNPNIEAFLKTIRDTSGGCKIVVTYCDLQADACVDTRQLTDFPVSMRIAICQSIPELIDRAVIAQSLVIGDALAAADEIEHILSQHRDNSA